MLKPSSVASDAKSTIQVSSIIQLSYTPYYNQEYYVAHTATTPTSAPVIASLQEDDTFITYYGHQIIIVHNASQNEEYEIEEIPFNNGEICSICLDKPKSIIYFVGPDKVLRSASISDKNLSGIQSLLNLPTIPMSMRLIKSGTADLLLLCYSYGAVHIVPTIIFESSEFLDSMKEIKEMISLTNYDSSISIEKDNINCKNEGDCTSISHRFIKQFRVFLLNAAAISSIECFANTILITISSTVIWVLQTSNLSIYKLTFNNVEAPIINATHISNNLICITQSNRSMIIYDISAAKELYTVYGRLQTSLFLSCKIESIEQIKKSTISKVKLGGDIYEFMLITTNGNIESVFLTNYRIQWDTKRAGKAPYYRYDPITLYKSANSIQAGFIMNGLIIIYEESCMKVLNLRGQCKLPKQKDPDTFTVCSNIIEIDTNRPKSNMKNALSVKNIENKSITPNLLSPRSGSQGRKDNSLLAPPKKKPISHLPLKDLKYNKQKDRNTPINEALTIVESVDSEKIKSPAGSNVKLPSIFINKDKKPSSNKINQSQNTISITITNELNCELEDKDKYKLGQYDYNIQSQNILIEECGSIKNIKSSQPSRYQKNKTSNLQKKIAEKVKSKHHNFDTHNLNQQVNNTSHELITNQKEITDIGGTTLDITEPRMPLHQVPYNKGYRLPLINVARRKEIQQKYTNLSKHQIKRIGNKPTLSHSISPKNTEEIYKPILNKERNIRQQRKIVHQKSPEIEARNNSIGKMPHKVKLSLPPLKNANSELGQIRKMLTNLERSLGKCSSVDKAPSHEYGLVNALTVVKSGGLNPEGVSNVLLTLSSKRAQSNNCSCLNEEFTTKFDINKLLSDLKLGKMRNKSVDLTNQSTTRQKPKK